MAILFSADPKIVDINNAIVHLKNNKRLYWEVGYPINKHNFQFPIVGYIHIKDDKTRYRVTIEDIEPFREEHYTGPDANKIKPKEWIEYYKTHPEETERWESCYVITKLEVLSEPLETTIIKKIDGANASQPRSYTRIIDPFENQEGTRMETKSDYKLNQGLKEKQKDIDITFKRLRDEGRIEFITFHPSYSYEEFIEGITIKEECTAEESPYERKDGLFKRLCSRALAKAMKRNDWYDPKTGESPKWNEVWEEYTSSGNEGKIYNSDDRIVLIIDEINRGDISKIFGELITLLEADKRLGADNELIVRLPYTNDWFGIPPNIYVIGTMNTADRSIALIDVALRRRFGFIEMGPELDRVLEDFEENNLLSSSIKKLKEINKGILKEPSLGKDKLVGHAFFYSLDGEKEEKIYGVWLNEIFPLLEEYFYSNFKGLERIIGKKEIFDSEKQQFLPNVPPEDWMTEIKKWLEE